MNDASAALFQQFGIIAPMNNGISTPHTPTAGNFDNSGHRRQSSGWNYDPAMNIHPQTPGLQPSSRSQAGTPASANESLSPLGEGGMNTDQEFPDTASQMMGFGARRNSGENLLDGTTPTSNPFQSGGANGDLTVSGNTSTPSFSHSASGGLHTAVTVPAIRRTYGGSGEMETQPASVPILRTRMPGQQARQFAREKAMEANLTGDEMTIVEAFADASLHEMLINLRITQVIMDRQIELKLNNFYLRSDDFKKRMRYHVNGVLYSSNVRAYVTGLLEQMLDYFAANLEVLKLSKSIRNDAAEWSFFLSKLSDELTAQRSTMKTILTQSIANKLDIYKLTQKLLPDGLKPKKEHWGRFAFLRFAASVYGAWKEQEEALAKAKAAAEGRPKEPVPSFWGYVDAKLAEMRNEAKEKGSTLPGGRVQYITEKFAAILTHDLKTYPNKSSNLDRQTYETDALPEWQTTMEHAADEFIVDEVLDSSEE